MKIVLILTFIINISIYASETFIAIKFNNKIFTNIDVNNFIINTKLTDKNRIDLFKKANSDYSKYNELLNEWIKTKFQQGLKQMSYFIMLQSHALSHSGKVNNKRVAFNFTENQYYDLLQKRENEVLKELLSKRLGIVKSREIFGEFLISQGYPHESHMSPTEVYFLWYETQKKRIKEEIRIEEVKKYESYWAIKHNGGELKPRIFEPSDFKNLHDKKAIELFEDKIINRGQINSILNANPELSTRIKKVNLIGLMDSKIKDLPKDLILKSSADLKAILDNKLSNIISYLEATISLKEKHKNIEKLDELKNQAKENFLVTNNYNSLMLARLYNLSKYDLEDINDYISLIKTEYKNVLTKTLNYLSNFEQSTFEIATNSSAIKALNDLDVTKSDFKSDVNQMISWVFQFEAKKLAFESPSEAKVVFYDFKSFEGYDKVLNYLKLKMYQNGLQQFRLKTLEKYDRSFELRNYDKFINRYNAFEYIING